jgi:GT2 family glycosyltransferase
MDELYFLYAEDVDLSWRAWLKGYRVLYEPAAQIIHFTNGRFERDDLISNEQYYGLRNFILISRKFFGKKGEESAVKSLKKALDPYLFTKIMDDYLTNIRDRITDTYDGKRDRHIMIRGINQFAD